MYDVDELFRIVKTNHIKSKSIVMSEGKDEWAVCINFLNIPDTPITLMTASMMFEGRKLAEFNSTNFRLAMTVIENRLEVSQDDYEKTISVPKSEKLTLEEDFDELFAPTRQWINDDWYVQVKAHRCFFVPQNSVRLILKHMQINGMLEDMYELGIKEVSFIIPKDHGKMPSNGICGNFYMNTYPKPTRAVK